MRYLLAISVGPVQEFIAAARRTSDLYAGSRLLTEVAKAAVQSIHDNGGKLIFPADPQADGPNKVLAEISDECDPKQIAEHARQAAQSYLKAEWEKASTKIPAAKLDIKTASPQIESFLEFYAAWVPYNGSYPDARKQVDLLLAGRKALRDFAQPVSQEGRPKSPLDPSRDSALFNTDDCIKYPLRLKKTETLDAVSLLKRIQGAASQTVPSTTMMAVNAILSVARQKAPEIVTELERLARDAEMGNDFSDFLFPERLKALEGNLTPPRKDEIRDSVSRLREAIDFKGEFPTYYALIVADGDRMGNLLNAVNEIEGHRKLSKALSEFAGQAAKIVSQHNGHCIYAGGDDVLALLPVNYALDCAMQLSLDFEGRMNPYRDASKSETEAGGTLSVGIAIVHHLDALQDSLERARAAEKAAKLTRNSLAVALHTRGGAPLTVAQMWADDPALKQWQEWIQAFRADRIARGFPYELMNLAREWSGTDLPVLRLTAEAQRILNRKGGDMKPSLPEGLKSQDDWVGFASKLVIARFLAGFPEVNHD